MCEKLDIDDITTKGKKTPNLGEIPDIFGKTPAVVKAVNKKWNKPTKLFKSLVGKK